MQKINLRELYPDIYKTDTYLEVTDEVQAVFLADKRAEARYLRQMYNYKAHYRRTAAEGVYRFVWRDSAYAQPADFIRRICRKRNFERAGFSGLSRTLSGLAG